MGMTGKGRHLLTPGQLVNAVAIALDVPSETVVQHDRNLVVAGLRTKGGRGHSAPKVTPLDAARLVTAVLGSVPVLESVNTVLAFERTRHLSPRDFTREMVAKIRADATLSKTADANDNRPQFNPRPIFEAMTSHLPPNHNFIEALAALIENASSPMQAEEPDFMKLFYGMEISCEVPRIHAYVGLMGFGARYEQIPIPKPKTKQREKEDRHKRYSKLFGISQTRSTPGTAIMLLGRAFFENGLPPKMTQEEAADWAQAYSDLSEGRDQEKAQGTK